jgi:RecA-family ATPase
MNILPVQLAHLLPENPPERKWLIEELWSYEAVGIIGGEPKCGKSTLALSLAVAVAGGVPCLQRFEVKHSGTVLLFAAEDALEIVRARLAAIAHASGVPLSSLKILVITRPSLRLDISQEFDLLSNTVRKFSPRLLILDPFVRLHRVDENQAGEVAPILSRLRSIQRSSHCAVVLVHHARKDAGNTRAGQALRGSSEFHAWGDSNLYLQRQKDDSLLFTVEHRAEKSPPRFSLQLCSNEFGPFHRVVDSIEETQAAPSPHQKISSVLATSEKPLSFDSIRKATRLRTQVASSALKDLLAQEAISRSTAGYFINK